MALLLKVGLLAEAAVDSLFSSGECLHINGESCT